MKLLAIPLILAATYTFPNCSKAESASPYFGLAYEYTNHKQDLYQVDKGALGFVLGLKVPLQNNWALRGDILIGKGIQNTALGLIKRKTQHEFTVGFVNFTEQGIYNNFNNAVAAKDTITQTVPFVEYGYKNFYGRFFPYKSKHTFKGYTHTSTGYEITTKRVEEQQVAVQLGYRVRF